MTKEKEDLQKLIESIDNQMLIDYLYKYINALLSQ